MADPAEGADTPRELSERVGAHIAVGHPGAAGRTGSAGPRRPEVFFGQAFAMVDAVEVCFREQDDAANLRAAAEWMRSRPGWFLRTLWYERQGAYEISQDDHGPRGALWLIAEHGSDDEAEASAGRSGC